MSNEMSNEMSDEMRSTDDERWDEWWDGRWVMRWVMRWVSDEMRWMMRWVTMREEPSDGLWVMRWVMRIRLVMRWVMRWVWVGRLNRRTMSDAMSDEMSDEWWDGPRMIRRCPRTHAKVSRFSSLITLISSLILCGLILRTSHHTSLVSPLISSFFDYLITHLIIEHTSDYNTQLFLLNLESWGDAQRVEEEWLWVMRWECWVMRTKNDSTDDEWREEWWHEW